MLSFHDTKNCVTTNAKKLREKTPPRPFSNAGLSGNATVTEVSSMRVSSEALDDINGLPENGLLG
jgi:hypothetical protein